MPPYCRGPKRPYSFRKTGELEGAVIPLNLLMGYTDSLAKELSKIIE
jgi:hypothetical protein